MGQVLSPRVPRQPTQVKVGRVVSDKMDKTALVEVRTFRRHPLYGHIERQSKRYMVHDEQNSAKVGDEVRFCLCRPISRHKSWILMEITRKTRGSVLAGEENTTTYREPAEQQAAEEPLAEEPESLASEAEEPAVEAEAGA